MRHVIFSSVFLSGSCSFVLGPFLACTAVSLLLGLLIAWTHAHGSAWSRSFLLTLVMLPAVVQTVIMLVNGSIGTGIAVAGAFSLIRFRSVPGGAREIGSIFLAMAIGLATGMGYLAVAALFAGLMCLVNLLLSVSGFGKSAKGERILRMTIPEVLDYEGAFDDLFDTYTVRWELENVRTANMGSMYKLCYRIVLKGGISEKALLDDLRCRNGNLEISCGKVTSQDDLL